MITAGRANRWAAWILGFALGFSTSLPAQQRPSKVAPEPSKTAAGPGRLETLLPEEAAREIERMLAAGRQSAAEEALERLLVRHPEHPRLLFLLAACIRSRFDTVTSGAIFGRVEKLSPSTPMGLCAALVRLCDDPANAPRRQEATDGLRWLADIHGDDPIILWMLAVQCRAQNMPAEGVQRYRRLAEMWRPGPVLMHQTFANVLTGIGNVEEALDHREIAAVTEPAPWSLHPLVQGYRFAGRHDDAVRVGRAILARVPVLANIRLEVAQSLRALGRAEEALAELETAAQELPGDVVSRQAWLRCLMELGRPEDVRSLANGMPRSPALEPIITTAEFHLNRRRTGEKIVAPMSSEELAQLSERAPAAISNLASRLFDAAAAGLVDDVRAMLNAGVPLTATCAKGCGALSHAAEYGHPEVVRALLKAGAPLDATNRLGHTALTRALMLDFPPALECARILLKAGARTDLGPNRLPALAFALQQDARAACALLLAEGADVNAKLPPRNETLLARFASLGAAREVHWLLAHGADPNRADREGRTPLMYAFWRPTEAEPGSWSSDVVRALLRAGADPNAEDACGMTALDWAALLGFGDGVRFVREQADLRHTSPRFPSFRPAVTTAAMRVLLALQTPHVVRTGGLPDAPGGGAASRRAIRLLREIWDCPTPASWKETLEYWLKVFDRPPDAPLEPVASPPPDATIRRLPPPVAQAMEAAEQQYIQRGLPGRPGSPPPGLTPRKLNVALHATLLAAQLGLAVQAGWTTPAEAELVMARVANCLRHGYGSWEDFAYAAEAGGRLFRPGDAWKYVTIYGRLRDRSDPNNPWVFIPWDTLADAARSAPPP